MLKFQLFLKLIDKMKLNVAEIHKKHHLVRLLNSVFLV
jgi:hypothetical protein